MAPLTMATAAAAPQNPLPPLPQLSKRRIAFTTPPNYAGRLASFLELRGATPLPFPTVVVEPTPATLASLQPYAGPTLNYFSSLAFTSRTGISAFFQALANETEVGGPPLSDSGEVFTISALGKDAEMLEEMGISSRVCRNADRVRIMVPEVASPEGLVNALGDGMGRKVLCPVPVVIDLEEPPVVPNFLRGLESRGWVPVAVPAYETRWAGRRCLEGLVGLDGNLDALIFTSTAEVEGLLKGLEAAGWDWKRVGERWPELVAAAHGPVTAGGAERLGIAVDVVSSRFDSFDGVLEALALKWGASDSHC